MVRAIIRDRVGIPSAVTPILAFMIAEMRTGRRLAFVSLPGLAARELEVGALVPCHQHRGQSKLLVFNIE